MEPINRALKSIKIPSFQERYEAMRKEILNNKQVQKFVMENEITSSVIDRSLSKLDEFISQTSTCCGAQSTACCSNMLAGFVPELYMLRGNIEIKYVRCEQKMREDEHRETATMISSMHMPKDVLKATLKDLMIDDQSRLEIAHKAADFIAQYKTMGELPSKGFYLYGKFGVGKSFVLGAIANELAALKVKSVVVFVPEFLREMKNSIQDQTLNEKIDYVKKAPVLMLDDIGAETMSAWTRDEILGTIMHYRMSEQLPTFITSNFDYAGLEHHLAQSQRGDIEVVKAARIMERIKAITIPICMEGINRRNS
ncbi:primosomal protein DnaI [Lysinibacillus sp. LZ02]|uniref:primosomal protein DnaI n=1 Tax=Lysinibacillus sp. LZ02 TaxID=3420668 RepID=UPI003D36F672